MDRLDTWTVRYFARKPIRSTGSSVHNFMGLGSLLLVEAGLVVPDRLCISETRSTAQPGQAAAEHRLGRMSAMAFAYCGSSELEGKN